MATVVAPDKFAALIHDRPALNSFALESRAANHYLMFILYERIAGAFQLFLGISGVACGVENWFMSLALMVYDGYHAYAYYNLKENGVSSSIENLDETVLVYAVGAIVGLVGVLTRIRKGIKADSRYQQEHLYILAKAQSFLAPATFGIELMMAFPYIVNFFGVGSPLFQKLVLKDGKLLLELQCHRIVIGFIAVAIINTGCLITKDFRIYVAYILTHIAIGVSMLIFSFTAKPVPGTVTEVTGMNTPGFLHVSVAVTTIMSLIRAISTRDYMREQQQRAAAVRPKVE